MLSHQYKMPKIYSYDVDLSHKLLLLEQEHRDLDASIVALMQQNNIDQLQVQRLKKRKLNLKDQITQLNDLIIPDIIA